MPNRTMKFWYHLNKAITSFMQIVTILRFKKDDNFNWETHLNIMGGTFLPSYFSEMGGPPVTDNGGTSDYWAGVKQC